MFSPQPISLSELIPAPVDALLIVPPFSRLDITSLGMHLLQARARAAGFRVAVVYANLFLARELSVPLYQAVSELTTDQLLGERIFAHAAYGVPVLGRNARQKLSGRHWELPGRASRLRLDYELLDELARHAGDWADRFAEAVAALRIPMVGCTTVFEQTASSIALLTRIKARAPETLTLLGGASCEGPMAEGIAELTRAVDYVFSGECEKAFPDFLAGARPKGRVVRGVPCMELESLPAPDYDDYFRQLHHCLGTELPADRVLLSYESSRGCWWGQKHHCTFCGMAEMRFREKSPGKVGAELRALTEKYPSRHVHMSDSIMPHSYFQGLLPGLRDELPGLTIFYEQKANLTLEKVLALRGAGISIIQPGIEALSSSLLKRMGKGLLARQNLALLRYARSGLLSLVYGLLHGLPGDQWEDYASYPALMPLLRHLEPPRYLLPLEVVRFSPYHSTPQRYGITNLRPLAAYGDVLPEGVDIGRLAYIFEGDYPSVSTQHPELRQRLERDIQEWNDAWKTGEPPVLSVFRMGREHYALMDTRGLAGAERMRLLSRRQAAAVLVGRPNSSPGELAPELQWAVASRYAVELDDWHVPLATAAPELLAEFEAEYGPTARSPGRVSAAASGPVPQPEETGRILPEQLA